jgi:hypothetical protein
VEVGSAKNGPRGITSTAEALSPALGKHHGHTLGAPTVDHGQVAHAVTVEIYGLLNSCALPNEWCCHLTHQGPGSALRLLRILRRAGSSSRAVVRL